MTRIDLIETALIDRGWMLVLAFTVSVILVGVTRKACRRTWGAEYAMQLWVLPPLAMLATQLPHFSGLSAIYPLDLGNLTQVATTMPHYVPSVSTVAVSASILLVWLSGVVVAISGMMQAQRRYWVRLRGASDVTDANARWPVLLASHTCIGPAMVGAWRVRIVLPSDFNERYDAIERALILAHESTHARRRDGLCCLLAQIVCVIFWFHPLAWLALAAFRLDQELACDAVVMREHGVRRRRYANALLKTQNADLALPVGCLWSPRHPLAERIAMLNLKTPSRRRRISGACVLIFSLAGLSSAAYAVSQRKPVEHSGTKSAQVPGSEYQLDVYAQKTTAGASSQRV